MKHKKHKKADSSYRRSEEGSEKALHNMQKAEKMMKRRMRSERHEVKQMHPLMKMGVMAMPHHSRAMREEVMESSGPKAKHHKKETKGEKKFHKVMKEFKGKKLHSGSKKGPKVKSRKQAIAIAYSEARRAKSKHSSY